MSMNVPQVKMVIEFEDKSLLTFWATDVKIDPPTVERDIFDYTSWALGSNAPKARPAGILKMTNGRIEATIHNSPIPEKSEHDKALDDLFGEGYAKATKAGPIRAWQGEWRGTPYTTQVVKHNELKKNIDTLQKDKEVLQAEMEDLIQENVLLKKEMEENRSKLQKLCHPSCSCPRCRRIKKGQCDHSPLAICDVCQPSLPSWGASYPLPTTETKLPWIERTLKRAIEVVVDFFLRVR